MNLYKKRILKSEEVVVVTDTVKKGEGIQKPPASATIMSERKIDAPSPIEEAYARGLSEGKTLGRREMERELGRTINTLKQAMNELTRLRSEIYRNAEREIVALALAIAEKIVHQEFSTNKEAVRGVFRSAVEAIGEKEKLLVRCHPGDLPALEGYLKDIQASQGGLGEVEFISDTGMLPGGVKIEAAFCEVDASLESQLAVIKKILFS